MDQRLLSTTKDCSGGNCPEVTRVGDEWHVQGYDTRTGEERIVRIPAAMGREAGRNDT